MTTPYNPDEEMAKMTGQGQTNKTTTPPPSETREAQPLNQDDAIILKDTKDDFDRTAVPSGMYDAIIDQSNFDFDKNGKPQVTFVEKITGPAQEGRMIWIRCAARSYPAAAITLKKLLTRSQKPDAKGEYHSIIESVDTAKPFDEKGFCDSGIAIGAENRLNIGIGKPWTKRNDDGSTTVVPTNKVKDILYPTSGTKFIK